MRKLICGLLCGLLLAGCTAPPPSAAATRPPAATEQPGAEPAAAATPEQALTEALGAVKTRRLTVALNRCIAFEMDSAGGSLKTAVAASEMVVYLAGDFVPEDLDGETRAWQAGLSGEDQATLDANWPAVYRCARQICEDPAAQQDLLDSAGVTTDFTAMDLTGVPEDLDTINRALTETAA